MVKYFLLQILVIFCKTGIECASNCSVQRCQADQGWDDNLFCYSEMKHKSVKNINCSWTPYPNATASGSYTLYYKQRRCNTISTKYTYGNIEGKYLFRAEKAFIFVTYTNSTGVCIMSKNISIMPNVKCDRPNILYSVHSPNVLKIQLDDNGEVRYRQISSSLWQYHKTTNKAMTITLERSQLQISYVMQQKCSKTDCFQCTWGAETQIPHELTDAPNITNITTKKLSPGRQKVSIKWKVLQSDHVEGYRLRVERLPNVCNINEYTYGLNTTEFELSLSMATYKISINAFNKAGNSPSVSSLVPYSSSQDFPGKIHATVQNNSIVLTWNPIRNCPFFIINWGTNTTQMKTDSSVGGNIGTYSLPGPFEAMKQYSIIIYEYETCECTKNISMETTYGIAYIYAEEGVPKTAPANITISNVTKHSAVLQWKEIPEMDCMGFLLGYKIYFTDRRRNITQDVIINSSTITSYLLKEITEGNTYEIKISGYTSKGEGVPSVSYTFTTPNYAQYEFETIVISTCIGIVFVVIIAVTLCVYIFHSARKYYFPKIPNPKYSNIVKIHEEMTGKNELMPALLLVSKEDFSGDTSHLEVTEEVQSVYVPLAESSEVSEDDLSLIKKSNTTNVLDPCGNQESKVQSAMVIIDYSNMNFMQNMMKNMLQPSSHGEQRNNDVQCNPPCTMALHDYIKDNVRKDTFF